jgi:membrane protein required for colicin V production
LPFPTEISLADALIALVLGLYVLEDLRRGFLFGLLSLVGFLVALVAALAFYVPLAGWLVEQTPLPYALAKPAAFALIWIVSDVVLAATLRRALAGPALAAARSSLGRLLGVATGLARAVLALTLALSVITALPLPEPVAEQIRASRLASYLVERGAGLQQAVAGVIEGAVGETLAVLTVRPESGERVDLRFTVSAPRLTSGPKRGCSSSSTLSGRKRGSGLSSSIPPSAGLLVTIRRRCSARATSPTWIPAVGPRSNGCGGAGCVSPRPARTWPWPRPSTSRMRV